MKDPARTLARLRAELAACDEPLERQALKRRIAELVHKLAAAEYRNKSAAVRRELVGAY